MSSEIEENSSKRGEYNKQGEYYLTTLETTAPAKKGSDRQTGVIVSPLFTPKSGRITFRVGGGKGAQTYVAPCTADGREVQMARGVNNQLIQKASWDLNPYLGQKMFIKIVDRSTDGWAISRRTTSSLMEKSRHSCRNAPLKSMTNRRKVEGCSIVQ